MVRIPFFDFDAPEPEPAEDPAVARAAAEAAHEAADQAAREVLYGREHAYAIRLGNEALRREQPALAAIDRGYRAARAGLGPEARAAFDARAEASRQAWRDQVQGRAADQRAKLKLESARLREHYAAYDLYRAVERGAEELVRRNVKVPLTQSQFDALVSLAFNAGPSAMTERTSTLLRLVNQGDFAGAASEFPNWNKGKVKGVYQVVPGLDPRRASEKKMFAEGLYDSSH